MPGWHCPILSFDSWSLSQTAVLKGAKSEQPWQHAKHVNPAAVILIMRTKRGVHPVLKHTEPQPHINCGELGIEVITLVR